MTNLEPGGQERQAELGGLARGQRQATTVLTRHTVNCEMYARVLQKCFFVFTYENVIVNCN